MDFTFANAILARRVRGWRVMDGVEKLSDHRYVRFDVSALPVTPSGLAWPKEGPRWVLKRLDMDALIEAVFVQAWVGAPEGEVELEAESV